MLGQLTGLSQQRGPTATPSTPSDAQPLPSVEPAFDLAGLLDELDASVRPALLSEALEGLDDRDDDFAMMHSFSVAEKQITRPDLSPLAQRPWSL
jgi:hypothetical protein